MMMSHLMSREKLCNDDVMSHEQRERREWERGLGEDRGAEGVGEGGGE